MHLIVFIMFPSTSLPLAFSHGSQEPSLPCPLQHSWKGQTPLQSGRKGQRTKVNVYSAESRSTERPLPKNLGDTFQLCTINGISGSRLEGGNIPYCAPAAPQKAPVLLPAQTFRVPCLEQEAFGNWTAMIINQPHEYASFLFLE